MDFNILKIKDIESKLFNLNNFINQLDSIESFIIGNNEYNLRIVNDFKDILKNKENELSIEHNNLISNCKHDFHKEITPYNNIFICSKCGLIKHE